MFKKFVDTYRDELHEYDKCCGASEKINRKQMIFPILFIGALIISGGSIITVTCESGGGTYGDRVCVWKVTGYSTSTMHDEVYRYKLALDS